METLFSILHVVAGVFIVGPMAILPMTGMRAIRAREAGQVQTLAKSVSVFTLLSLVVVLFGFALLGTSDHNSFSTTWVWLSTVFYAVALGLNLFLVVPALRSAAENVTTAAGSAATGKVAGYARIAAGSGIVSLLLVAVVVLMVWRP
ncbi:DUF2269 family protein [Cryobacterium psychrophilum]|uniref:DUF2269 family protein n=1 Tax=Cryobacterium psychrophilum TaxID=41988 RepID=A0A4Y8KMG3_9MICO|nr:DUF2269 family protein [Cryobacterium psychrophilum]TDW31428.1 putative integral membrane protein DUF2269 [Cryobacterium psychrophilum]TFD78867.1 DUF2269 family protein [Cryobacterium psychrophilum]